jgi:hypothetical protein
MPKARTLAEAEGLPSRNRLKAELRVGSPKATQIRQALANEGYEPTAPEPAVSEAEPRAAAVGIEDTKTTSDPAAAPVLDGPVDTVEVAARVDQPTEVEDAVMQDAPVADPDPQPSGTASQSTPVATSDTVTDPSEPTEPAPGKPEKKRVPVWPVLLLLLPASVAIWSGWVGLGKLAGFGPVHPLPGIADGVVIDSSITLPIGMETYSAYALFVWLSGRASIKAVKFARASALLALAIGSAGQVAYHLMAAPKAGAGPVITAAVACIPVAVLGLGASLGHLVRNGDNE